MEQPLPTSEGLVRSFALEGPPGASIVVNYAGHRLPGGSDDGRLEVRVTDMYGQVFRGYRLIRID